MPVQISHVKLAMKSHWGRAPELLARLDAARAEGIDITADIYPYTYWQSNMMVLIPSRDLDDREAFRYALEEIAPPEGFWLTRFEPEPALVGLRLTDIAERRGQTPLDTFIALTAESAAWEAKTGEGADSMIGTSMTAADVAALLTWPHTNVCTDGGLVDRHPRAVGAFPRVLGRMVREEGLLTLAAAVHKMSGLSARHLGFTDRGLIRPGQAADLVLFDPDRVIDRATPEDPFALSVGIERVWVNGEPVWESGAGTGRRPGQVLTRQAQRP
jgi:N-acyl-D-amino-acid deacylase